jgi:Uma2 family endonuclease
MSTIATPLMTAAEFYDWVHRPENLGKYLELERGEVVEMPPPGPFHGFVCGNASRILGNYSAQRRKGFICTNDSGFIVANNPDSVRGPDVAYYADVKSPEEIPQSYTDTRPQLIVEVVSPHDKAGLLNLRIEQYLKCGVPLVWVIDPDIRIVTIYRPGANHTSLVEHEELTGNGVLPDFRCQVREFFALPGR